ncbi:MAG: hypothetical protein P8P79_14280 [Halioglobus sp.]|nr:hypothetical protein [Halioglobus sp.]
MKKISCLIFLSLLLQISSAFAAERQSQEELLAKSVARAWWNKEVTIDLLKLTATQREEMDESLRIYLKINQGALQAQKESFLELDAALFEADNDGARKTGEQMAKAVAEGLTRQVELMITVLDVLKDEQRTTMASESPELLQRFWAGTSVRKMSNPKRSHEKRGTHKTAGQKSSKSQ